MNPDDLQFYYSVQCLPGQGIWLDPILLSRDHVLLLHPSSTFQQSERSTRMRGKLISLVPTISFSYKHWTELIPLLLWEWKSPFPLLLLLWKRFDADQYLPFVFLAWSFCCWVNFCFVIQLQGAHRKEFVSGTEDQCTRYRGNESSRSLEGRELEKWRIHFIYICVQRMFVMWQQFGKHIYIKILLAVLHVSGGCINKAVIGTNFVLPPSLYIHYVFKYNISYRNVLWS